MVFSEVCHSCGGCSLVCPENAVTEREKPVGRLQIGMAGDVKTVTGILNPGEASGIPVIREALKQAEGADDYRRPSRKRLQCDGKCDGMRTSVFLWQSLQLFGFHNFSDGL